MKKESGFTLIELLIVIAIIGILSSVVLASLNTARAKGKDAKVKAQLSGLRNAAENFYGSYGNYGTVASDLCTGGDFFTDALVSTNVDPNNYPPETTLSCHTDGSAYAVSALLPTSVADGGTLAWCVDSEGNSMQIADNLGDGILVCQ